MSKRSSIPQFLTEFDKDALTSTPDDFKELMKTRVWKDFRITCIARLELLNNAYASADSMQEVANITGEKAGIEYWLRFPSTMVTVLEAAEKTKAEEKANESGN